MALVHQLPAVSMPSEQEAALTYKVATNAAGLCGDIVKATATKIQGKKYVQVEGWLAIAAAHGCLVSIRDVEQIDGGIRAIAELRRMSDQALLATAEGFVGDDEKMWAGRPMYARRAMAQTRASSRVCRSAFAFVVVLIDKELGTTPAEEMIGVDADGPGSSWGPRGKEGAIDDARADGLMDNAPKATQAKMQRLAKWIKNMEGTLQLSGQTAESIKALWDDPKDLKNHDDASEILPDEYQALVQLAIKARKEAAARSANTLQAG